MINKNILQKSRKSKCSWNSAFCSISPIVWHSWNPIFANTATRWPDYFSIFGHLKQWKFAKVGSHCWVLLNKPSEECQRFLIFYQRAKRSDLVTLFANQTTFTSFDVAKQTCLRKQLPTHDCLFNHLLQFRFLWREFYAHLPTSRRQIVPRRWLWFSGQHAFHQLWRCEFKLWWCLSLTHCIIN